MEPRRQLRVVAIAWSLIAVLAVARAAGAVRFPLSGDEAYYWEWSRRLALGYVDHPPLVAWTIALFDHGARSAIGIRIGFIASGLLAAFAASDFATRARGSPTAGALAALLVFAAPLASLTFVFATPDGPFLLAWCAALSFALRAFQTDRIGWWAALGAAVGCAMLARFFGAALLAGIAIAVFRSMREHRIRTGGPLLAFAIACAVVSPLVIWNSENAWAGVQFALVGRHVWHGFSADRAAEAIVFTLVGGALFAAPLLVAAAMRVPRIREPWAEIAWWSAAPLIAVLAALSFFEPIEVYWLAGPLISLLAATAILYADRLTNLRRLAWAAAPSAAIACAAAALAITPRSSVVALFERLPARLSSSSVFEIYSYERLANDLSARYRGYAVVTDGYGLSSLLDFYGGIPPIVVGYNEQGQEASRWFHSSRAVSAIYVDPVSLDRRPDVLARLQRACGAIGREPELVYRENATLLHAYSITTCGSFNTRGLAELNGR